MDFLILFSFLCFLILPFCSKGNTCENKSHAKRKKPVYSIEIRCQKTCYLCEWIIMVIDGGVWMKWLAVHALVAKHQNSHWNMIPKCGMNLQCVQWLEHEDLWQMFVLSVFRPGGVKYQKALEWRIPVVNVHWLNDLFLGELRALKLPVNPKVSTFWDGESLETGDVESGTSDG